MKKQIIILFTFIASLSLISCDLLDELTTFLFDVNTQVTIPQTIIANTPYVFELNTETNVAVIYEENDTHNDLLESILLDKCSLELRNPSDATFGFLQRIDIYLTVPGQSQIQVAWADTFSNTTSVELETTGEDLKNYLKEDSYSITVKVIASSEIPEDYELLITNTFLANAQLLGS